MLRETKFTIDTLGDRAFEGYTQGDYWNGWACPYFTFEQAQQIVNAHHEHSVKAWYDKASDQFEFALNKTGEDDVDTFPSVELEGKKLYPIGSGCWIWEEG